VLLDLTLLYLLKAPVNHNHLTQPVGSAATESHRYTVSSFVYVRHASEVLNGKALNAVSPLSRLNFKTFLTANIGWRKVCDCAFVSASLGGATTET